ncbi:MAG: hypothetical protein U0165_03750 [Polyangiaceae bacterium]
MTVEAKGFEPYSGEVTLREGGSQTLETVLKAAAPSTVQPEQPKLAKVSLVVRSPKGTPQIVALLVDGQRVNDVAAIPPQAIGEHRIHIEAVDHLPYDGAFTLKNDQPFEVSVTLEAKPKETPTPTPAAKPSHSLAIAGFSVGAAGILVGGITGALSLAEVGNLKSDCRDQVCPPSKQDGIDRAKLLGNVSTVAFIVGGVGVGVGLYDLFRGGSPVASSSSSARGSAVSVNVGPGSMWLSGGF